MVLPNANTGFAYNSLATVNDASPVALSARSRWGVPLPCVRLVNSLTAILAVFHSVVDQRVSEGDEFIAKVHIARSGCPRALQSSLRAVPAPRVKTRSFGTRDYQSRFVAALTPTTRSAFCSGAIPEIPLKDYITRFFTYCPVKDMSNAVFLLALALLDRALAHTPHLFLNSWNAHRLVLGSFVFAAKMHEDEYTLQEVFAKHGGVTLTEMNLIEAEFFKAIDYRGFVHHEDFKILEQDLVREALTNEEKRSVVFDTLRSERISGIDYALNQALEFKSPHTSADSTMMLHKGTDALSILERNLRDMMDKDTFMRKQDHAIEVDTIMRAAGAASAFAQVMFPDLQVEPPATEQELSRFLRRAADYPPAHLQKFRLFRDIIRSPNRYFSYLRGPSPVAPARVVSTPPGFSPVPSMQSSGHRMTSASPTGISEMHMSARQWGFVPSYAHQGFAAPAPLAPHLAHESTSISGFSSISAHDMSDSCVSSVDQHTSFGYETNTARTVDRRTLQSVFEPRPVINNGMPPRSDAALINAIGNAWGRRPDMPDIAQTIAKSAVAYILNDDDPFQDLPHMPSSHARMSSMPRNTVLGGLVYGQ